MNGRIEDLSCSSVAKGKKIVPSVMQERARQGQTVEAGVDTVLIEAGFDWREPGPGWVVAG